MNYTSENNPSFLNNHIADIIKKYNYEDMIKTRFEYMWAMQDQPQEAVQTAQDKTVRRRKINQYIGAGWVAAAFWAKGIFEQWNSDNGVVQQNRLIFILVMSIFFIITCIYFIVNYALRKPFNYQQIAYFLSVDYLIISELQNGKELKTTFIKIADIAATKLEHNHLAIYLDSLKPTPLYGINSEQIKNFIDSHLEKN